MEKFRSYHFLHGKFYQYGSIFYYKRGKNEEIRETSPPKKKKKLKSAVLIYLHEICIPIEIKISLTFFFWPTCKTKLYLLPDIILRHAISHASSERNAPCYLGVTSYNRALNQNSSIIKYYWHQNDKCYSPKENSLLKAQFMVLDTIRNFMFTS